MNAFGLDSFTCGAPSDEAPSVARRKASLKRMERRQMKLFLLEGEVASQCDMQAYTNDGVQIINVRLKYNQ